MTRKVSGAIALLPDCYENDTRDKSISAETLDSKGKRVVNGQIAQTVLFRCIEKSLPPEGTGERPTEQREDIR
jgi:hypothetical protein